MATAIDKREEATQRFQNTILKNHLFIFNLNLSFNIVLENSVEKT